MRAGATNGVLGETIERPSAERNDHIGARISHSTAPPERQSDEQRHGDCDLATADKARQVHERGKPGATIVRQALHQAIVEIERVAEDDDHGEQGIQDEGDERDHARGVASSNGRAVPNSGI